VAGFALMGLGLAVVYPNAVSAAGRQEGEHADAAVAAVSAIGYSGFLVGPPIVGFTAQLSTLSIGMISTLQCSVGIVLLSRALPRAERRLTR
jgi:MFS family permease